MTEEQQAKAERVIGRLQDDDLQNKLRGGFERDFANSVIDQWNRSKHLSPRQLEVAEDLVDRYDNARGTGSGRRYEGFSR